MIDTDAILRKIQIDLISEEPNEIINWFNNLCAKIQSLKIETVSALGNQTIYSIIIRDDEKETILILDYKDRVMYYNYGLFGEYINILGYSPEIPKELNGMIKVFVSTIHKIDALTISYKRY